MARRLFHFGASNQEESSRNNRTSVKSSKQALVVYASKSWWMNRLTGSRQDEAMKQTGSHLSGAASFTLRCEMQTTGLHPQAQRQAPSLAVPPGPSKSESKEQRTNAELQIGAEPRLAAWGLWSAKQAADNAA